MKRTVITQEECNDHLDQSKSEELSTETIINVIRLRIIFLIIWSGAIIFATYHVFKASDEFIPWQKDPVLNPGPLTGLFGRGRDTTDYEWTMFISLLITKLMLWYAVYTILKFGASIYNVDQQISCWLPPIMSWFFLQNLMGWKATLFLFSQPFLFYFLMKTRSKVIVWIVTLVILTLLNVPWYRSFTIQNGYADYYFTTTAAWNYARCLSFCFDTWDVKTIGHKKALSSMLKYCFYFPLVVTGPIILYSQFEKDILQKQKKLTIQDIKTLLIDLVRIYFWIIVNEVILHYIYFTPLSLTPPALREINLWTLCGIIYWLGQFFMIKYLVMYGISTCFAKFDGLEMPPLPRCISYIHRYSLIWKDFDRGLYYFLVRYTYLPVLKELELLDKTNQINFEFKKLIASLSTFIYIYVWHSVSYDILIWATLNFIGITIERIGSFCKRKIEIKTQETVFIHPMFWDFIIEPFFTIPLAFMSILNSSIFCGNLSAAIIFTKRIWKCGGNIFIIFFFLYCFTQVAVAIRTWKDWWNSLSFNVITNMDFYFNFSEIFKFKK